MEMGERILERVSNWWRETESPWPHGFQKKIFQNLRGEGRKREGLKNSMEPDNKAEKGNKGLPKRGKHTITQRRPRTETKKNREE